MSAASAAAEFLAHSSALLRGLCDDPAGRTIKGMSEANGTSPQATADPAAEQPCENCATSGEKALAVLGIVFAVLVAVMAVDMFTGGRVTGYVTERRAAAGV